MNGFAVFTLFVGLVLGWLLGGISVYNREIEILNGFRRRLEKIEREYREWYEEHQEPIEN